MLTDTKLKNLKPQEKLYKVSDRDGLYVAVLTSGSVSFRYDYRINGRRETLVIGQYAQAYHLPDETGNLTATVRDWRRHWPAVLPLPHPSPRNNLWLSRNPWFEAEVLPALRQRVAEALG
mgnify:CR=1 FL=1